MRQLTALAKACDYTLTFWTRLSRFLEYPELELSNNLAENAMRPIAIGRNYEQSGIMQIRQARLAPFERKLFGSKRFGSKV